MEDSKWLDLCIQRGHLNQTDVKKWIATRSEQIRNAALLLSLSPALAIVAILCVLGALLLIGLALRKRTIQLRHYALIINQHLVDLLTLSIIVVVGCTVEIRDAFNSIGFLTFLICIFAFTNTGLSQTINTLLCFIRLDCQNFYAKLRVEYILTGTILIWFFSAICTLVFSPLFFVLEFSDTSNNQECTFHSCQSPMLLSFSLGMVTIWLANFISYSTTFARLYKQKKQEKNDVPLAAQILRIHWLSIGLEVLFCVIGMLILFILAALAYFIFEMHQLNTVHMECQLNMRLDIISKMQLLGSSILLLWILRAALAPITLIVVDFKNLIGSFVYDKQIGCVSKSEQPIKVHCCSIDKVSWCRTV